MLLAELRDVHAAGRIFRTFTTVRYYLALAAALYGIRFVLRRQYGCFVIWIGIAALFHKSVLMVLPLYLLAVLPWKNGSRRR